MPPKNGGTGSLSIAPGSYLLLVDDAAAFIPLHSGLTVSIIDTVLSLPNTEGTISLLDAEGATVDSISYTKDNGGAGDGNSLTRKGVSGESLTSGSPTPGKGSLTSSSGNSGTAPSSATSSQKQTTSDSEDPIQNSSTYVGPPETQLFADGGSDRAVIVGADVQFVGRAYNRKKEIVSHARLVWNFGDGSTAEGTSVFHNFNYPGKYIVVLDIAESENSASDQIIVTAEKAEMALSVISDGSVLIQNRSARTLDLSRWIVRQDGRNFVLPDNSRVLAGASMQISQKTLGFIGSASAEFAYPNGITALHAGESTGGTLASVSPSPPQVQTPTPPSAPRTTMPEEKSSPPEMNTMDTSESNVSNASLPDTEEVNPETQAAAAARTDSSSRIWWLGAVALAALAGGALFVAQRFSKREWDITEEK